MVYNSRQFSLSTGGDTSYQQCHAHQPGQWYTKVGTVAYHSPSNPRSIPKAVHCSRVKIRRGGGLLLLHMYPHSYCKLDTTSDSAFHTQPGYTHPKNKSEAIRAREEALRSKVLVLTLAAPVESADLT